MRIKGEMKVFFSIVLLVLNFKIVFSQSTETVASQFQKLNDQEPVNESLNKTLFRGELRSFYMQTVNEGSLKDDYALATGAGLGVITKSVYGFQFGLSGFFIANAWSSQLDIPDTQTKQPNRYEIGLFDIEHPSQKLNLNRLEDLFLRYTHSKSNITVGRIKLNTPFLNPQEGRMRPTMAEGIWIQLLEWKKFEFQGGWIQGIGVRSTMNWHAVQNSIGIYPSGVSTDGAKSNYQNSLNSAGMAILNIKYKPTADLTVNIWDGLIDNILNTAMIEVNHQTSTRSNLNFYEGLMYLHQDAINAGGNQDPSKTYINRGAQSNVISAQLGIKYKRNNTSLNYTHITGDGRYLMPREWGREEFYTFLPRERNEGFGNVHAIVLKYTVQSKSKNLKYGIGYGYYHLPDVKDFRLNKYAMPSYQQLNLDATYRFSNHLKGLQFKTIILYKLQQGEDYGNLKVIYNKVNMFHLNIILDYSF